LGGSTASAIANLIVRLLSEHTGRGPTRARTSINDDFAVETFILAPQAGDATGTPDVG
jgi:uncharacterized protein YbcI